MKTEPVTPHDIVGINASLSDLAMAEAVIERARQITHECGTPEASERAVWATIVDFFDRVRIA
jgi:hypothetical protein